MADYEVSAAYIDSLVRVVRGSGRVAEVAAVDSRVEWLMNNPWADNWHPAELLEVLGEAAVQVLGEPFLEEMAYQAMKQRFGGIVLPMIKSSLASGTPATVFSRLDGMVKVAIKGIELGFRPDGDTAGVFTVTYPRPVAPHTQLSWRGVIRFIFEVTGKTATGVVDAQQRSADGRALEYRVRWG
jgi:hypothetical protein